MKYWPYLLHSYMFIIFLMVEWAAWCFFETCLRLFLEENVSKKFQKCLKKVSRMAPVSKTQPAFLLFTLLLLHCQWFVLDARWTLCKSRHISSVPGTRILPFLIFLMVGWTAWCFFETFLRLFWRKKSQKSFKNVSKRFAGWPRYQKTNHLSYYLHCCCCTVSGLY